MPGLDFVLQLSAQYPPHDYCTQYRESDFNFACRLMEEEGIYYFFEHFEKNSMMVLADGPAKAHTDVQTKVNFGFGRSISFQTEPNRLFEWEKGQQLRSSQFTLRDHHFELSSPIITGNPQLTRPLAVKAGTVSHQLNLLSADHAIIDYPGDSAHRFDDVDLSGGRSPKGVSQIADDNDRTAKVRMQQETVSGLLIRGTSSCAAFAAGSTFNVTDHFNANGQYLLVSVTHAVSQSRGISGNGSSGFTYQNGFTCIPFDLLFRPPRIASRPFIAGAQTAIVVGFDSKKEPQQEIFTDKFGRVKVQFHWDQEHDPDVDCSCWVRVAQVWAGKGWGASFWPRIGQEVIVAFLEGNPDQPIIVGSVYNAGQMPPYLGGGLDRKHANDNKVSGIKTCSTPGGQGFNEIRFDDAKGKEQLFLRAQSAMDVRVGGDQRTSVGGSQHLTVGSVDEDGNGHGTVHEKVCDSKASTIENILFTWVGKEYVLNVGQFSEYRSKIEEGEFLSLADVSHTFQSPEIRLDAPQKIRLTCGASHILMLPDQIIITSPQVKINSPTIAAAVENRRVGKPLDPQAADDSRSGFPSKTAPPKDPTKANGVKTDSRQPVSS